MTRPLLAALALAAAPLGAQPARVVREGPETAAPLAAAVAALPVGAMAGGSAPLAAQSAHSGGYAPGPAFCQAARRLLRALAPPAGFLADTVDLIPAARAVQAVWWRPGADGVTAPVPIAVKWIASDDDLTLLDRLQTAVEATLTESP